MVKRLTGFFKRIRDIILGILHSDNLFIGCIGRFVLYLLAWGVQAYTTIISYYWPHRSETKPIEWILQTMTPEEEIVSLNLSAGVFLFILLAFWISDVAWIYKKMDHIPFEEYKRNAKRNKNVFRYIVLMVCPMLPFLMLFPILYLRCPDQPWRNVLLTLHWPAITAGAGLLQSVLLSTACFLLLAVFLFVVPFFTIPSVCTAVRRISIRINRSWLRFLYGKMPSLTPAGIVFHSEYCNRLNHLSAVMNEAFAKMTAFDKYNLDSPADWHICIYLTSGRVEALHAVFKSYEKTARRSIRSAFVPVCCRINGSDLETQDSILIEEGLKTFLSALKVIEKQYADFDAAGISAFLLKTADLHYPKHSGLKRTDVQYGNF